MMSIRTAFARQTICVLVLVVLAVMQAMADGKMPVTTSSAEARKEFLAGRTLFENLKRQDAAPHFKQALALDPSFAIAAMYYGLAEGTARGFFENLAKAVELAPQASEGERELILGWQAGAAGRTSEQKTHWEAAVRLFPEDERALTQLGIYYFGRQEYRQAVEYFTRAITVNPSFPQAYNQLGYAHRFLGDIPAAETAFRRYTELIPDDPNPFDSYAELMLKIGRFGEAITAYRKALAVDPGFIASYVGIAAAQMYQDRPEEARAEMVAALRKAHDDGDRRQAYIVSALTYVEEGKTEYAIAEMKKAFAIAEKAGDAAAMGADLGAMAAIRFEAGDLKEAVRLYAKAADVVDRSALAEQVKGITRLANRYNTAMLAAAQGAYDQAWEEASTMQRDAEALGNVFQGRLAHEAKGRIALLRKEPAAAIDEFKQASDLNPYNLYRMGQANRMLGKEDEARRWFSAAAGFNGLPQLNYAFIRDRARVAAAKH
jgi:tetratricopeptide (TPR) repeat protein